MTKRIIMSVMLVALLLCSLAVPTFAAETTPITYTDVEPIITALQAQITVQQVISIIAAGIGVAIGFVFMWWGARKVSGMLMKAFKKGKISI